MNVVKVDAVVAEVVVEVAVGYVEIGTYRKLCILGMTHRSLSKEPVDVISWCRLIISE